MKKFKKIFYLFGSFGAAFTVYCSTLNYLFSETLIQKALLIPIFNIFIGIFVTILSAGLAYGILYFMLIDTTKSVFYKI
jgi:hypothetical protein